MSIPIPVARSQLDLYPSRSRPESDVESRRSNVSKRSKSSRKYVSPFPAEQNFLFYNWQSAMSVRINLYSACALKPTVNVQLIRLSILPFKKQILEGVSLESFIFYVWAKQIELMKFF